MERTVNVLNLDKIAQITYTDHGRILDKPTREQCINALRDALNIWNERIERIVTKAASNELARVQTVHHLLNPIEAIMNWIYHHNALTEQDIEDLTRTPRIWDWIDLLKSLDILDYGQGRFGLGSTGQGLRERSRDKDELVRNVISMILSERYSFLEEIMNIKVLNALIHTNSCYYRFCIDADRIVKKKPQSIHQAYEKTYGRRSYVELFNTLMELSRENVVHYENPYITANEEILERINKLGPPHTVTPPA